MADKTYLLKTKWNEKKNTSPFEVEGLSCVKDDLKGGNNIKNWYICTVNHNKYY